MTIQDILTAGLLAGYAGETKPQTVKRGSFELKSSEPALPDGTYVDQWIAETMSGGGQELVQSGDEKATRLYAGGTISHEALTELGITEKEVVGYLIKKILELGDKTRLFEDCEPSPDGDWRYSYKIRERLPEIGLTTAMETITYKEALVFAHAFMHSPIK